MRRSVSLVVHTLMAVVVVAALAGPPAPLAAQKSDTLQLRNGDRIIGEIKELRNGLLEYDTDNIGTISVKWDRVVRLWSQLYFEVETIGGKRRFGTLSPVDSLGYLLVTNDTTTLVRMVDVVGITRIKQTGFFDRIDGYFDLGFSYAKSNETLQLTSGLEATYRLEYWSLYLKQDLFVQTQNGADRTSRWSVEPSVQRRLPAQWLLFAEVQLQQNQELDLDLRALLLPGIGRDLVRTNSRQASVFVGIAGQREWYSDTTQASGQRAATTLEGSLSGNYRSYRYDNPERDITATLQVFPSLSEAGRVRAEADLRARYEAVKDFFFTLAIQSSFDSQPPSSDSPQSDVTTTLSLTWKF